MESLLPFVYENHRQENQELFVGILAAPPVLEDPIWGRVAFVLGAYGNYMYRYPLSSEQKLQVWQALFWAVFYERCYRRKYLAQRFQQVLHFFQGCATDQAFQKQALEDLDRLTKYLEANSLKKLQETLQTLPELPEQLAQRVATELVRAQTARAVQTSVAPDAEKKEHARGGFTLTGSVQPSNFSVRTDPPDRPPLAERSSEEARDELTPRNRAVLSFLTDEQIQSFFTALRVARLDIVNQLLQQARLPLLATLCQELKHTLPTSYQAPRRPIRLGRKQSDRFQEARRLLYSERISERQVGLRMFEQGARDTTHPDYVALAREWMLYARAVVQGSPRVVDDWERDLQRDEASWEEIWNLAFFYQQNGYLLESLRVLRGGLDGGRAPVMHLQLGLVCALDLLLKAEQPDAALRQNIVPFLLAHLEQWPHPLSYLAWLVLASDVHGNVHPRQQSHRLSIFQELSEHALHLPDPQKELLDTRIASLETALVEKARCDEAWFLWINDYAERHPRKYQSWARLAETSERLGKLKTAELALQHLVEIQYQHDYARYQEGEPQPRAEYLRRNLEKLFEFYQRYHLLQEGEEAFTSCYPSLSHLWETHDPGNRRLIALTRPYQEARQRREQLAQQARRAEVTRDLAKSITVPLEPFHTDRRVGMFVDYENIARFIPHDMDAAEVGSALSTHAGQFGEVICRWASASPQNLSNLADVRAGLEEAGFKVRFPRRELQFSVSKKNLADFALLECLSEAQASDQLDIYLIVSGDRDYYERVCSLLDAGHTVRLIAASDGQHLSSRYRELEQQRLRTRQTSGYEESDFFIDNLETILGTLVSQI
jgi:hypothetical protein